MSNVGGVARRMGPPACGGTCNCNFEGLRTVASKFTLPDFGEDVKGCGEPCIGTSTVEANVCGGTVVVGASLMFGLAGKVEKGPSWTERLLGGRPRILPAVLPWEDEGQALETADTGRLRVREGDLLADAELEEGRADAGSSKAGLAEKACLAMMADCGCEVTDVSLAGKRQGICCADLCILS